MEYRLTETFAKLYEQNRYLLNGELLSENEVEYYNKINPGMDGSIASGAINSMSEFLHRYYGKEVIILLDEYDTPMQEAKPTFVPGNHNRDYQNLNVLLREPSRIRLFGFKQPQSGVNNI